MAKVTGPLMSVSASGQIAKSMVFFPWKGLAVVRGWIKPANPQTPAQGLIRLIIGGLGRATSVLQPNSPYKDDILSMTTGKNTFVSEFVQFAKAHVIPDQATLETVFSAYDAHSGKSAFVSAAATLGLLEVVIPYQDTDALMTGGFLAYLLAAAAIAAHALNSETFNRAPYTTALASWTSTQTGLMVTDCASV